jgi:serine carboxypeptidase-like clade 2
MNTHRWGNAVVQPWTTWRYESQEYGTQIAGYITKFKGISLVTVHGAGHEVPQYKPEQGLAVLKNFLSGEFTSTQ